MYRGSTMSAVRMQWRPSTMKIVCGSCDYSTNQRAGIIWRRWEWSARQIDGLSCLGISSICNLLAAIKTAKYFELDERDVIFTVFTDSTDLYGSRLQELQAERGAYKPADAMKDHAGPVAHQKIDYFKELTYPGEKGDPQPQVLHLGGAARKDLRGTHGSMESRVLASAVRG